MQVSVIKKHIKTTSFCFFLYDVLDSTNTFLMKNALDFPDRSVVIAHTQSAGRGRSDRSFFCSPGSGIYMSLLLRHGKTLAHPEHITCAAAVAVCEAVEEVTGKRCGIKWVNDVILDDKKICGILTEGVFADGVLSHAVLGVGINLRADAFPEELKSIAGSIFGDGEEVPPEVAERLVAAFLDRFAYHYDAGISADGDSTFFSEYSRRSVLIGKEAVAYNAGSERPCRVLSVGKDCSLRVMYEDGEVADIRSGEMRIRTADR